MTDLSDLLIVKTRLLGSEGTLLILPHADSPDKKQLSSKIIS